MSQQMWEESFRSLHQAGHRDAAAPSVSVTDSQGHLFRIDFWRARSRPNLTVWEVLARAWLPDDTHQFDVVAFVGRHQVDAALTQVRGEAVRRAKAGDYKQGATYTYADEP